MKRASVFLALILAASLAGCRFTHLPYATHGDGTNRTEATASHAPKATALTEKQILAALGEIAFTSEYGATDRQIRKWAARMNVAVHGSPTEEDRATLQKAMDGLNAIPGFPGIGIAEKDVNVDIWFVKLAEMPGVLPDYEKGNWGYFTTHISAGVITDATIAIASDVTRQNERNHLIFEEVLQSTGLMQDLYDYPDSIFYGGWTTVQQPLPMDWEMLRMLYLPALSPGMGEAEAMAVLKARFDP
jgi:hypothetical protein